ncbi:MAG: beta strand repeat-containing protein, partial [Planctomyces sp.]
LGSTQFQQNVTLGDGDTGSSFAGSVNFDGLNWSSYDGLTLGNATTLSSGAVSLNSNGGAIAFSNTVDGTQKLTLIAGSGRISFDASVGDTDPLSSLQITSAADVTFSGTVDANALTQLAGTGTTTFSDTVILTGGLNLTGTHFSIAGRVEAGGAIAVTNTGALTTTSDGSLVSADSFAQVGTGSSSIGANITTAGDLSFASAVTLTADVALNSRNAGSISFGGTLDGPFDLTLTAGGEDVSFLGFVGASAKLADISIVSANDVTVASILRATTFTQTAGTGTTLFSGATTLDGELDYAGNNLTVNAAFTSGAAITVNNTGTFSTGTSGDIVLVGNFAQTGIGESSLGGDIATGDGTTSASSISFATAITLTADVTLSTNSGSNNGDITVSSSVTGLLSKLSLAAGTGNIQFDSAIDSVSLAGLLVSSAGQLTLNSALTVDSQGVDITAGTVSVNNTLRTLNSGMLEITNSGVLTVPTGSTFTLDGAFLQNGTGTVSLADDITTTDDDVAFTAAVTLAAAVAIDT